MEVKPTTHIVEVVKIKEILPHPNADKMELVKIFGFTCCVGKGQFSVGDLVAYIQPDSVVPDIPEYAFLKGHFRIGVKRLRGIYSQGLIVPAPSGSKEGDDVSDVLCITHYEPPEQSHTNKHKVQKGESEKAPKGSFPLYDIEAFNRYADKVFTEGEMIVATEKVHGANSLFCFRDGEFHVRSRRIWKRPTKSILLGNAINWIERLKIQAALFLGKKKVAYTLCDWWVALERHSGVKEFLRHNPQFAIYGEIYGKVQSLKYNKPNEVDLVIFDILNLETGLFLDWSDAMGAAYAYNLPWVPLIYEGPYDESLLRELAERNSLLAEINGLNNQIMEGLVIKPVNERQVDHFGRAQLKLVSNRYYEKG